MSDPARDEEVDDLYRRLDAVMDERDEARARGARAETDLARLRAVLVPSDENVRTFVEVMNETAGAVISGTAEQCDRIVAYAVLRALSERAGIEP